MTRIRRRMRALARLARAAAASRPARAAAASRLSCERGQATAEYTLVTLVAGTMALLLLNWVKGGAVTTFFESIFDKVVSLFA